MWLLKCCYPCSTAALPSEALRQLHSSWDVVLTVVD
jgi:hypothetical protein